MVSPDIAAGDAATAAQDGAASTAPSGTPDSGTTTAPSGTPEPGSAGQFVDLADPERYRYEGRPVKELYSGYMRQQDYSQKTQAIAQERRFYDNLEVDLERVRAQPALVEQFKAIYPEKFHAYLRWVSTGTPSQPPRQQQQEGQPPSQQQYAQLDPRTKASLDRLIQNSQATELKAINAEIDQVFSKMSTKYPYADEEACIARGQALLQALKKNDPLNQDLRITEQQWDSIWKSQHERSFGLADTQYKKLVNEQIKASKKGADAPGGGGIPGQAPRVHKTIKEASDQARADAELGVW